MSARLLACHACARHIRVDEPRCPFCGEARPDGLASTSKAMAPPLGLTRAGLIRFGAMAAAGFVGGSVALAGAMSCSNSSTNYAVPYGAAPDCGPTTFPCPEASPDSESDATGDDGGSDAAPDASPPSDGGDGG